MRNIPYLFCILLFVNGVFGVEELLLMVGDSVTLNSAVSKKTTDEKTEWLFGKKRLAEIKNSSVDPVYKDVEGFKDRLVLDKKTRSLTIKNISTEHSGEYKQNIGGTDFVILNLNVKGVSAVDKNGVKSVSVMKGDSVTLHTGFTQIYGVKWTFKNGDLNPTDDKTGNLTIPITGDNQSGNYVLEINNTIMFLQRTYHVDLIGEKPRVSVKEGERILLSIGVKNIQTYDLILLNFKGNTIAKIDKNNNLMNDIRDKRLQLDVISGSLVISNSSTTDAGDYNLTINSSTHSLQRTISVTVTNSGMSTGAVAGIVVGLLVFAAVIGFLYYYCKTSAK